MFGLLAFVLRCTFGFLLAGDWHGGSLQVEPAIDPAASFRSPSACGLESWSRSPLGYFSFGLGFAFFQMWLGAPLSHRLSLYCRISVIDCLAATPPMSLFEPAKFLPTCLVPALHSCIC